MYVYDEGKPQTFRSNQTIWPTNQKVVFTVKKPRSIQSLLFNVFLPFLHLTQQLNRGLESKFYVLLFYFPKQNPQFPGSPKSTSHEKQGN